MSLYTRRDTSCVRGYRNNSAGYMILGGYQVAHRPAHGNLSASGPSFTYSPAKAFVGVDHFVLELDFVAAGSTQLLVNYLDVTMEVMP